MKIDLSTGFPGHFGPNDRRSAESVPSKGLPTWRPDQPGRQSLHSVGVVVVLVVGGQIVRRCAHRIDQDKDRRSTELRMSSGVLLTYAAGSVTEPG